MSEAPALDRVAARLSRLSFTDSRRAAALLTSEPLAWWDVADNAPVSDAAAIAVAALSRTADPDAALEALTRIVAAPGGNGLRAALEVLPELRGRLFAVLGVSTELAGHLCDHPADWEVLLDDIDSAGTPRRLAAAIGADPDDPVTGTGGAPAAAPVPGGAVRIGDLCLARGVPTRTRGHRRSRPRR